MTGSPFSDLDCSYPQGSLVGRKNSEGGTGNLLDYWDSVEECLQEVLVPLATKMATTRRVEEESHLRVTVLRNRGPDRVY